MAKFCTECGKEIAENIAFCTECGTQIRKETVNEPPVSQSPPVYAQPPVTAAPPPAESKTVSTGVYFILMLVFALPVVGIIACIISAFASGNKNIKNFAKAMFIWLVIALVFAIILSVAGYILGGAFTDYISQAVNVQEFEGLGETLNELSQFEDILGQYSEYGDLAEQLQNSGFEEFTTNLPENNY